ncbi:unnamed protein product [Meloidogyne enterolobii]|uniref:Uncharacterized protein n=1 Tax=Meloidogyne enterolobii TaxID=390850 RepID=A0ACB1AUL1_MELEN
MSNLDRKIIEHEGVKYYKKGGQWYQMFPIGEDNVPADIKTKKSKLNLQPEIQLDVLKCLTFIQLLSFQQTSFYFKNFIDTFEKQLARKKYDKLEMVSFL